MIGLKEEIKKTVRQLELAFRSLIRRSFIEQVVYEQRVKELSYFFMSEFLLLVLVARVVNEC
uniref:Uncharacterized protein n=1 Tax=Utricularia reniformis TaxID=192314 RepID=A0A1Y0B3D8_9LAMI|nr:hypothetical protein AEK19_MT1744 [Utricularia reniformis]ART31921.1 hypothetical protein AEK19_MT1744 [Utricularia reniformis]